MKRSRGDQQGEIESIAMANYLMLLSRGGETESPSRTFECKTCNRQFPSFQALGGHRASHKKPRWLGEDQNQQTQLQMKPKTHECSICGLEFAIGQALGGHMRRHRSTLTAGLSLSPPSSASASASAASGEPGVKKSQSSRRVMWLDLNLTPLENGLDFQLGMISPVVDCFI